MVWLAGVPERFVAVFGGYSHRLLKYCTVQLGHCGFK